MRLYALEGEISKELLTFNGQVLTHTDKAELEFLVRGAKVVECPGYVKPEEQLPIPMHPDLQHIPFPLDRRDFK